MQSDVSIPELPASVQFAEIANIHVKVGQQVKAGDILFDVETEKVVLEVEAYQNGIIETISVSNGDHVSSEQVVMSLVVNENQEIPTQKSEVEYVEHITEKRTEDDSGRVLLEQVVGNSLFDKRGLICGSIGLIIGLFFGVLATVILIS